MPPRARTQRDSPPPSPPDLPLVAEPPAFLPPELPPTPPSTQEAPATEEQPPPVDDAGPASEQAEEPAARRRSTRTSTDIREAVEALVQLLLGLVTWMLHARLAPEGSDAWLADEDDMAAIAPPIARIAVRHAPVNDVITGDVADGLQVAIGAGAYAVKNVGRAARDRAALGDQTPAWPEGEPPT